MPTMYGDIVDVVTRDPRLATLARGLEAAALSETLRITGGLRVNGARVVQTDLPARNGMVHLIDGVLRP